MNQVLTVDCRALHPAPVEDTNLEISERIQAEREADRRADVRAILVVFSALVAAAVHFISGWTF